MNLFLFQLATLQPDDVPVPAYLVQTDDGHNILIDSGFPAFFAGQTIEIPGGRTVAMDADGFIVNRLATIGVRPEDVDTVICTHLDADHAGGHAAFSNASRHLKWVALNQCLVDTENVKISVSVCLG